ncbi:zinc ribbon domain-containing protein [Bacillus sp. FJAT-29790]|uniref:zinc ribbon domain-containing protein n=1 Tax=Bacillus sp. FJAT-29790 TaxID=1895002 RepID=UPI001C24CF26|nr:zinc ribbon domain-containing protein [Bacillus sp. FJAT-29790]MBU8881117.1 zinc ribbon domain-containing protein [Bacillus sp. FJAT-29790]
MKFCPECGTKRIEESKFCHECGYKFLSHSLEPEIEKEVHEPSIPQQEFDDKSTQEIFDIFFKNEELEEAQKLLSAKNAQVIEDLEKAIQDLHSIKYTKDTDSISYKAKSAAKDIAKTVAENSIEQVKESANNYATDIVKTIFSIVRQKSPTSKF